MGLHVNIQSAT